MEVAEFRPQIDGIIAAAPVAGLSAGGTRLNLGIALLGDGSRLSPGEPVLGMELVSALWLLTDHLDESHTLSQEIHTPTGSYLHAVMHRREPDAFNSKYWFRRVGPHPVVGRLREEAARLGYAYSTPETFVDDCERTRGKGGAGERLLEEVQHREMHLLIEAIRASIQG